MRFASIFPDRRVAQRRALCLAVVAACALGTPWRAAPAAQEPVGTAGSSSVFRSGTDLVVLQVSVADTRQKFVTGLGVEDFAVFEEGVSQRVALFASGTVPLDVLLLLDTSSSMAGRLGLAQEAAVTLVGALRPDDRAGIILFHDRVEIAHQLSTDRAAAVQSIRAARPGGATALHESIYIGLRELERVRRGGELMRRQAMVVLSDGADNRSHLAGDEVLDAARRSAVTIFTIVPTPRDEVVVAPWTAGDGTGVFEMRRLASDTGGRHFTPAGFEDLATIYRDIGSELGEQYWLAYAPSPPSPPGFRRVWVRVANRPDLHTRTRSGYFASAPRRPPPPRAKP